MTTIGNFFSFLRITLTQRHFKSTNYGSQHFLSKSAFIGSTDIILANGFKVKTNITQSDNFLICRRNSTKLSLECLSTKRWPLVVTKFIWHQQFFSYTRSKSYHLNDHVEFLRGDRWWVRSDNNASDLSGVSYTARNRNTRRVLSHYFRSLFTTISTQNLTFYLARVTKTTSAAPIIIRLLPISDWIFITWPCQHTENRTILLSRVH